MIRVAIDGPAGVGKSSTSKALAKYFGYAYLDTGAMYRACAWWCLKQGIDLDAETVDERVITEAVGEFFTGDHFDISVDPDNPRVFADDEDISSGNKTADKIFDLQESTYWSTNKDVKFPHYIVLDLGAEQTLGGFQYLPRVEQGAPESIKGYKIYVKSQPFKF